MTYYISTSPYLSRRWNLRSAAQQNPRALPVNLREQEDAYTLTAYLPGLAAENLNIQVLEDTLTIEGEYPQIEGEALLNELSGGAFRRALRLPTALDAEKTEAQLENGVLTLRLPKAETARARVIKVASN